MVTMEISRPAADVLGWFQIFEIGFIRKAPLESAAAALVDERPTRQRRTGPRRPDNLHCCRIGWRAASHGLDSNPGRADFRERAADMRPDSVRSRQHPPWFWSGCRADLPLHADTGGSASRRPPLREGELIRRTLHTELCLDSFEIRRLEG